MSRRVKTAAIICGLLFGSWYGMQVVHEAGHVLAARVTGGRVERVVLWPWTISRTDVSPNPQPLAVVWGGPIFGIAAPLLAWALFRMRRWRGIHVARFFAGFCLVANGLYLGLGSFEGIGDAGDLLRLDTPPWALWLFGAVTTPCGVRLWHGQRRAFGLMRGNPGPTSANP